VGITRRAARGCPDPCPPRRPTAHRALRPCPGRDRGHGGNKDVEHVYGSGRDLVHSNGGAPAGRSQDQPIRKRDGAE